MGTKKPARRVLADNRYTKADPSVLLKIEGIALINEKTGKPFQASSDGIEIDKANGYLYYQALVGRTLYRIKLADLENAKLSDAELGRGGGARGPAPAPHLVGRPNNSFYFPSLQPTALDRLNLDSRDLSVVVKDARL